MTTDRTSKPADGAAETPSLYESKPVRKSFSRRNDQPRLTPEQSARQSRAVSTALRLLASPQEAMAFLNADQEGSSRPIELAVQSDEGLAQVERLLTERASAAG